MKALYKSMSCRFFKYLMLTLATFFITHGQYVISFICVSCAAYLDYRGQYHLMKYQNELIKDNQEL